MPQFEGNSFKSKQQEKEKLSPVVSEKPTIRKKKWTILDCFCDIGDKSLSEYFIKDLLIPNLMKATGIALHGIVSKMFGVGYGSSSPYKYSNGWSSWYKDDSYVEYSAKTKNQQPSHKNPQASTDLESYTLRSRDDAERVLEGLDTYIEACDAVPVSAFFELIGVTAPYTYNDYGWTNLADAKVISTDGGYSIRFPRPIRLR